MSNAEHKMPADKMKRTFMEMTVLLIHLYVVTYSEEGVKQTAEVL